MAGKTDYKNRYAYENYEQIRFIVKKGIKSKLQTHATKKNESLNGFVTRAVNETMKRDNEEAKDNGV